MADQLSNDRPKIINVLLIEDELGYVKLIERMLSEIWDRSTSLFRLSYVNLLSEGVAYLATKEVDIVLLDLWLPDSCGLETFTQASVKAPDVPFVVLSVSDDEILARKVMQAGAQDYLVKDELTGGLLVRAIRHAVERHEMRRELQSNEVRFRTIIEENVDAIIVVNQDGISRYVNPAAEALFDRPAGELIGNLFGFPVVADESAELDILRQDDRTIVAEMRAVTTQWRGETVYVASLRDVTERKQAEERFRLVVEWTPNAIVVVNQEAEIVLINSQAEQLFGYKREELIGRLVEVLIPERVRTKHVDYRANFITHPEARPMGKGRELYALRKDGSEVPVEIGLSPIQNKEGLFVLAVIVDITERKQAEEERAQALERERAARAEAEAAQHRLAFLAEASQTLISSLDYEATLNTMARLVVPDIADWCAVDVLEENGSLNRVAVVHSDPAKVQIAAELQKRYPPNLDDTEGVASVLRTGQSELYPEISDAMLEAAIPDQDLLRIMRGLGLKSAMIVPLVAREEVFGAITFVAAESDRHYGSLDLRLAEELARRAAQAVDNAHLYKQARQLNAELEQRVAKRTAELEAVNHVLEQRNTDLAAANEELESFSYSVSHDLRAPLRAIDGFSRILASEYASELPAEAQRYLNMVRTNTEQMGQLIEDLLTFSRLTRQQVKERSVDPATLVRQIFEDLQPQYEDRRVELRVGELPTCEADPAMLRQVWLNLLENALKYTRKRDVAVIEVGFKEEDGGPVYFIKDNGVGFDMRYVHKLFGVFQRLHRAEEYEGTGVGLATVQRIIRRHGGRVWAEAEVDQGATFYFTI